MEKLPKPSWNQTWPWWGQEGSAEAVGPERPRAAAEMSWASLCGQVGCLARAEALVDGPNVLTQRVPRGQRAALSGSFCADVVMPACLPLLEGACRVSQGASLSRSCLLPGLEGAPPLVCPGGGQCTRLAERPSSFFSRPRSHDFNYPQHGTLQLKPPGLPQHSLVPAPAHTSRWLFCANTNNFEKEQKGRGGAGVSGMFWAQQSSSREIVLSLWVVETQGTWP